ncbi:MAG: PilZ domain-containing protein [Candidatus Omnitrophica bacterium]|nr:PilZ domain-containing protein [Candidatus Omnitrophota bacterium]
MGFKNKRENVRLNAYHLARYKIIFNGVEKTTTFTLAYISNISKGGASLITDKFLPLGSILDIDILFPHLENAISCIAKIVWMRRFVKGKRYRFGIQFIEMDDEIRKLIDEQIKFVDKKFTKGGKGMKRLAKVFVVLAVICVLLAIVIKLTTLGTILPAAMPINWIKLADTALLFAIALALLGKKE